MRRGCRFEPDLKGWLGVQRSCKWPEPDTTLHSCSNAWPLRRDIGCLCLDTYAWSEPKYAERSSSKLALPAGAFHTSHSSGNLAEDCIICRTKACDRH